MHSGKNRFVFFIMAPSIAEIKPRKSLGEGPSVPVEESEDV
jgi:hypothetical protein